MNNKQLVLDSINHRDTNQVPVDFGATPVSGMHVSCVAGLREYYGLEQKPVKVVETYQMLGEIDDELQEVLGTGVIGVQPRNNVFG